MAQPIFPVEMQNLLREQELLKRPETKRMTQLDKDMADILSRTDLSPYEKITKWDALIRPFRIARENVIRNGIQLSTEAPTTNDVLHELISLMEKQTKTANRNIVNKKKYRKSKGDRYLDDIRNLYTTPTTMAKEEEKEESTFDDPNETVLRVHPSTHTSTPAILPSQASSSTVHQTSKRGATSQIETTKKPRILFRRESPLTFAEIPEGEKEETPEFEEEEEEEEETSPSNISINEKSNDNMNLNNKSSAENSPSNITHNVSLEEIIKTIKKADDDKIKIIRDPNDASAIKLERFTRENNRKHDLTPQLLEMWSNLVSKDRIYSKHNNTMKSVAKIIHDHNRPLFSYMVSEFPAFHQFVTATERTALFPTAMDHPTVDSYKEMYTDWDSEREKHRKIRSQKKKKKIKK